ncbi:unannotated protein [freshwater metagenome]|uniref:Unannotated protein n=1 Tax=freshwater metagenome TaxID=449393 RepID=A0A6J6N9D2_9ZZZZ
MSRLTSESAARGASTSRMNISPAASAMRRSDVPSTREKCSSSSRLKRAAASLNARNIVMSLVVNAASSGSTGGSPVARRMSISDSSGDPSSEAMSRRLEYGPGRRAMAPGKASRCPELFAFTICSMVIPNDAIQFRRSLCESASGDVGSRSPAATHASVGSSLGAITRSLVLYNQTKVRPDWTGLSLVAGVARA